MGNYVIEIEVEYDGGKTPKKTIDFTEPLIQRNIDMTDPVLDYNVSSQIPGIPVSGGSIPINDQEVKLKDNTTIITPVSFNVRARYDLPEKLWNIDVYVDKHDFTIPEAERKLIVRREKHIHKEKIIGDSENIKVNWSVNGIPQDSVVGKR